MGAIGRTAHGLGRRRFLGTASLAAGAFALGWPGQAVAAESGRDVGLWVVIGPDDTTTIRVARSEMGQGTLTGLAQLVADELDADWSRVRAEYVTPEANLAAHRAWGSMSTGGSQGIRGSVAYVREGGAAARAMLIEAAAGRWGVPVGKCRAEKGAVLHEASGRSLRYGALAEAAAKLPVRSRVVLKTPDQWTIIGQPLPRLDTAEKLNGSQVYGIDVKLPDMLLAAIAQCPVFGGTLASFDAAAVASMPGVRHVLRVDDHAVAVVADTWWQAQTALKKLPITWSDGPAAAADDASIAAHLASGLGADDADVGHRIGDAPAALAGAGRRIDADYGTPFLNHATMEPMNCTALLQDGRVEVWAGTQNGDATLEAAARAAGVPPDQVRVHKVMMGGGFGRRGAQDPVRQAVLLARQVPGRPVKLIWSREQDMQHGLYRPVTQCRLAGKLDANGNLVALHMRLSGQSILASLGRRGSSDPTAFQGLGPTEFGYLGIPNLLIDYAMRNTHVPVGFWRGVNHNQNAIFLESFIDELATAAGRDPLAFRRAMMERNPKHLAVLNAAAAHAGWDTPAPPGVFRGIAQHGGFGSYTAAVAEVSLTPAGDVTIRRIVAATDPGHVVNPDQVRAQVEGSFAYGLSAMLFGHNTIEQGRVAEANFDTYPVVRMAEMPKVETILMPSGGFWGGVGEPTISVGAPAVLNAIFAATGQRVRTLPLSLHALKRA